MSFGALNVIQRCELQHHALLINSLLAASIGSLAQSLKKNNDTSNAGYFLMN
jgi:hypothetical protein